MAAPISREYRIYLAIWRKAGNSPEPIVIKTSSKNMAIAMRQGMYRAIRPYRESKLIDDELRKAAENYVVYLNEDTLEMRPRLTLGELNTMFDQIGIDEEDLLLGDERDALGALKDLLDGVDVKPRITPFYNRDQ